MSAKVFSALWSEIEAIGRSASGLCANTCAPPSSITSAAGAWTFGCPRRVAGTSRSAATGFFRFALRLAAASAAEGSAVVTSASTTAAVVASIAVRPRERGITTS